MRYDIEVVRRQRVKNNHSFQVGGQIHLQVRSLRIWLGRKVGLTASRYGVEKRKFSPYEGKETRFHSHSFCNLLKI